MVLWSARWFVGLIRDRDHLLDEGHVGDTVVGGVFFSIVAIIGLLGVRELFRSTRDVVLKVREMSYTGVPGRGGRSTAESESELLDAGLRDLKVPVCVDHTRHASLEHAPFVYESGGLIVASYRFYRAFCALNRIV